MQRTSRRGFLRLVAASVVLTAASPDYSRVAGSRRGPVDRVSEGLDRFPDAWPASVHDSYDWNGRRGDVAKARGGSPSSCTGGRELRFGLT